MKMKKWEVLKLMAGIIFAMAAGAALYHQYIMMAGNACREEVPVPLAVEYVDQVPAGSPPDPVPVAILEEETPEEIAEEMYYDSLELLACCVEAEAGNQNLTGKRMVADVVLNRVDDKDFPDSIEGVITEPYRFSSFWNGVIERAEPSEETWKAVNMELQERGWPGLLYFTAGGYSEYGTPWKQVGDHYFSTK